MHAFSSKHHCECWHALCSTDRIRVMSEEQGFGLPNLSELSESQIGPRCTSAKLAAEQ